MFKLFDVVMHRRENCFISPKCNRGNRGTSRPLGTYPLTEKGKLRKVDRGKREETRPLRAIAVAATTFFFTTFADYLRLDRFQDRHLIFSRPDAAGNSSQNFSFRNPLCFSPFETWLASSRSSHFGQLLRLSLLRTWSKVLWNRMFACPEIVEEIYSFWIYFGLSYFLFWRCTSCYADTPNAGRGFREGTVPGRKGIPTFREF